MEDRWEKLRQIVREELELALQRFQKTTKPKIELVNGRWVGITQEQREAWEAAYGAVDLDAELKKAAAWCVSNPALSPKSQIGRFLNTWLTRQQNQLSLKSIPTERKTEIKAAKLCEYCGRPSTGAVGGWNPCDEHWQAAMDGVKPMGLVRSVR